VLGRIYGTSARGAITGITLLAGFASTVGWPLTAWGAGTIGWRDTCLVWAAFHVLVGLPANYWLLPRPIVDAAVQKREAEQKVPIDRPMTGHAASIGISGALSYVLGDLLSDEFGWRMAFASAGVTAAIAWITLTLAVTGPLAPDCSISGPCCETVRPSPTR
jgi:predicted MFS family arabinose efflux permease